MNRLSPLFTLFLICSFSILQAQTILTPEKVVEMRWVTSASIQPQGEKIAYTLRVPRDASEKPGSYYSELWVVDVESGKTLPFVQKPYSVGHIQWASDGASILFVMKRHSVDPHSQVYRIPVSGGEAQKISHAKGNVLNFKLSPDGQKLAFTMKEEEPEEVKKAKEQGFDQTVADTWTTQTRLYVEDLASGEPVLVSQDRVNIWDFGWTPDSRHLIYRASERPFTDDSYMFTRNYKVSAEGGPGELIHPTEGKLELAQQSPDGHYIAWLGAVDIHDPYPGSLFIKKANSAEVRNLLEGFKATAESFVWKDKQTLLLTVIENTRTYLYEVLIPSGKMKKVMGDNAPIFREVSLANDGKTAAFVGNSALHPNEVYIVKLSENRPRRLTHSNPDLSTMAFGQQETISWKGPDDLTIFGVLIKPWGFREGQRYPLIVVVHGGPESAYLDGWNTYYSRPVQLLAQRGYMVLIPNYRGSIGRGVAFSKADHKDMMGKEFDDILAGIDYLIDKGWVDGQRVGIGGGSYGGFTSAWAATRHSQRFKAAVVFAGISNQVSKEGTTDIPEEIRLVHWEFALYENFELAWERSPLKYVSNSRTATLIAHGEKDKRVPVGQAYELYRGLKHFRVPVQLVVYPREPHGLRERAHQLDFCTRLVEWYDRYLKGERATE